MHICINTLNTQTHYFPIITLYVTLWFDLIEHFIKYMFKWQYFMEAPVLVIN